jgi:hypothetical protein
MTEHDADTESTDETPVSDRHPDVGRELRERVAEVFGVEPDVFHPNKGRRGDA